MVSTFRGNQGFEKGQPSTRGPDQVAGPLYKAACPRARQCPIPDAVEQWSLTTLREKLIKIGAKIVRHGRYVTFQMAEVAIPRDLFADIMCRIDRLRPKPCPA